MIAMRKFLFGPPGCGKTESLLRLMEAELRRGVPPERVAFVSFTKAAVMEARNRACDAFHLTSDDLPLFRTVHSLCYRAMGLRRSDVFGREALERLSELTGEILTSHTRLDEATLGEHGDAMLHIDQYSRNVMGDAENVWLDSDANFDRFRLRRFIQAYRQFRRDEGLVDFTDMLESFNATIEADCVFIDEAQDLTPLQWRVIERAFHDVELFYIAGDDDQAIHTWCGATLDRLLNFDGQRDVLRQSHRVPKAVHSLARDIVSRIRRRQWKEWLPAPHNGDVTWNRYHDAIDLRGSDTFFLLTRTRRQLSRVAEWAREQGIVYEIMGHPSVDPAHVRAIQAWEAWRRGEGLGPDRCKAALEAAGLPVPEVWDDNTPEWTARDLGVDVTLLWHDALVKIPLDDREYMLACLRNGESLTRAPRVKISTIHGTKGAEAEQVVLFTDITSRIDRSMETNPDDEARVWYVGITRARNVLHVVEPQGRYGYNLDV